MIDGKGPRRSSCELGHSPRPSGQLSHLQRCGTGGVERVSQHCCTGQTPRSPGPALQLPRTQDKRASCTEWARAGVLVGAQDQFPCTSPFLHVSTLRAPRGGQRSGHPCLTKGEEVTEGWGHSALPSVVETTAPRGPESSDVGDQSSHTCLFLPQQGATLFHFSKQNYLVLNLSSLSFWGLIYIQWTALSLF